tara:strand:- start:6599 stop:7585 length:987 start_codon:yes stop_codon:yes gene_type:complete
MAKFLNKKERVYDFKLTSYGHYLLSNGMFAPALYSFLDDNVIYDASYAGRTEKQNDIHERIKNQTQYIESLVLFEDVEKNNIPYSSVSGDAFSLDTDAVTISPRKDTFRFNSIIGDALLEADTQNVPAWKLVTLQGEILSSQQKDISNDVLIPQINMTMNYRKKRITSNQYSALEMSNTPDYITRQFSNGEYLVLEEDDLMLYIEELNTILLNENFDIEVFESIDSGQTLKRKRFVKNQKKIENNVITQEYLDNYNKITTEFNDDDVEYFFEIYRDDEVNRAAACKGAEIFNKQSYYIDLDFDCYADSDPRAQYFDIYGPVTEPEICL